MRDASSSPTCRPRPSSTCGCASCASSRRWSCDASTTALTEREGRARGAARLRTSEQWKTIAAQIRDVREDLRARDASSASAAPTSPTRPARRRRRDRPRRMVEREPITVVVSEKGWIRALKGHVADLVGRGLQGRRPAEDSSFFAETTSKLLVLATNGKVFTLEAVEAAGRARPRRADPPDGRSRRGRRHRRRSSPTGRARSCSSPARTAAASSSPRTSSSPTPARASRCSTSTRADEAALHRAGRGRPRRGRSARTASCSSSRSTQLPEMARGKGVRLQKYKDGGLSDAKIFAARRRA